jgi:hypothetical protein
MKNICNDDTIQSNTFGFVEINGVISDNDLFSEIPNEENCFLAIVSLKEVQQDTEVDLI